MSFCRRTFAPLAGAVLFVLFAPVNDAAAQMAWGDRAFVNVNIGQQWMGQTVGTSGGLVVYEEQALWESNLEVDDSIVFDASAGYRVWKNLALAVGFSSTSDSHDSTLEASIPDLLLFDSPHSSSVPVTGLERSERAIHVSAVWMLPVTDKFDVAFVAGPSFFTVKQDFVSGMTVTPGGTTVGSVERSTIDGSATGYHVGIDGTFRVVNFGAAGLGIGAMARYSNAKVDAPTTAVGSLDAGGFHGLVGLRFRF
jgi:hypothetical protein